MTARPIQAKGACPPCVLLSAAAHAAFRIACHTHLRGRAVEKLTEGLPRRSWEKFTECPYEDLTNPERVQSDASGNIQLCQGFSTGNMCDIPLSDIAKQYDADSHTIWRPLVNGGAAGLAKDYNVPHNAEYIDACHICYLIRRALIDRFPEYLGPRSVYGVR